MSVVIETTLGDITIDLFLKERPNTCLNFLKLCKVKYYNFCVFYKIERNFIAQTGDPTSTGRGGESIFSRIYGDQAAYFEAELKPRLKHEKLGTLSMVDNGNGMNGSQFFLTLNENLTYLDEVHTVFGEVVEGFETLLKINEAICDPNNRPYQDILITHTVVLHDPYDDPPALEIPDASPLPTKEQLESNYIRADEEIDDTKGKSAEEIEEKIKESEAKARATILEMVGDIPDADVKPPETVLFVCKLNPVTTSEDLEIIFSRFGLIKSCEVIKDKKTGDSLQYAFIEFEKEEDCENAYFKMDNVLIDDRRIHVDFSQSVSKMMLDKGGKFPKNKNPKDMFVIKYKVKKSDGYDMIFDMDDEITQSKKKNKRSPDRKYQRHESPSRNKKSPDRKYKRHESPSQKSNKISRKRSLSLDRSHDEHLKSSESYRSREHNRSKFTRDNTYKTSKDHRKKFEKHSSPSEDFENTSFSRGKQANYSSRNRHDSSDESDTTNSKIRTDYKSKHRNNSNISNLQYASRNRHDSSNESGTTISKIRADYKSKRHHNRSSSSRSVSPPKRQKHSTDKTSSSKYDHSALKHHHRLHKRESHAFYESKEKKNASRHKSSSSESDVPRQSSKIKSYSQSPEYSSQRTNKAKYASSEKLRSHQRLPISRKQSSSPESYSYKSNSQKVIKSHQQTSKSFNSSNPERKKQSNRSQSRSVSPVKHTREKTTKCSKKSKKNKKRNKSSSSFSDSDSNSSFQQKRNKDNTSHSKTHKSQKDHKHRR